MTLADRPKFDEIVQRVAVLLPQRAPSKATLGAVTTAYFEALEPWPVDVIARSARTLVQDRKVFPTLADWIAALGPAPGAAPTPAGGQRTMSLAEIVEWEHARRSTADRERYQGEPCRCDACRTAGVDHRFLRFVPDEDAAGSLQRAWHPQRREVVITGHWAHGWELDRWYRARTACLASIPAPLRRVLRVAIAQAAVDESEPVEARAGAHP